MLLRPQEYESLCRSLCGNAKRGSVSLDVSIIACGMQLGFAHVSYLITIAGHTGRLLGPNRSPDLRVIAATEVPTSSPMTTKTTRLSTRQASEYLGVPEATLRWWRSRGKREPKSYALSPRHVVYDLVDLDAWVAAQKENTERGGEE